MTLPKSVRICGIDHKITLMKHCNPDNLKQVGVCMYLQSEIKLSTHWEDGQKLSDDYLLNTLLHEVLHAIESRFDMEFKEKQIELLSNGLFAFLKDNPGVFK